MGAVMVRKLSDDDSRVVDMLLDSGGAANGPALTQVFSNPNPAMFEKRVEGVERILAVLSMDPASEPPIDLVARTMSLIEDPEAIGRAARASRGQGAQARPNA